jgi:hypothetical protein
VRIVGPVASGEKAQEKPTPQSPVASSLVGCGILTVLSFDAMNPDRFLVGQSAMWG